MTEIKTTIDQFSRISFLLKATERKSKKINEQTQVRSSYMHDIHLLYLTEKSGLCLSNKIVALKEKSKEHDTHPGLAYLF